ncbi:mitochondrial carrier protein domain-containing protein [Phthorimaea operculella]|nr:mitochondrial carrier protein domain-containing protein [Phthorimaea operculella]
MYSLQGGFALAVRNSAFVNTFSYILYGNVAMANVKRHALPPMSSPCPLCGVWGLGHGIVKEEGVLKLWRGATPTVARAMVVNAAQLSTYSQAREIFAKYLEEGIGLHFCASMVSGLITTIASMPVDIIKTRIQNAAKGTSQVEVVTTLLKKEGFFSLWKGFLPYYARLGPHTVLTFIFLEQFNAAYFNYTK